MSTSASPVIRVIDEISVTPLQIAVVILCFILSMLEGFDILAISYASVAIAEDLSLTSERLGLLFSAGLLGMTIGALFLAVFSDVFGRRRMILAALLVAGTGMCLTGLSTSFWLIALFRLITGLGVGVLLATVTATVAEFMPERHRSLAVGLATAGYPAGAVLGGVLSAGLINIYGWPSIFFSGGVLTLFIVLVVFIVLPESLQFLMVRQPKDALQKINRTLEKLKQAPLAKLEGESRVIRQPGPGRLLDNEFQERTLWLWLCFGLAFATLYFLISWIPRIVEDSGVSKSIAIYALTFFNLGAVVGIACLGRLASYIGLGRMILIFMVSGGALMVAFPFVTGTSLMLLCAVLGALVQGGFVGLYAAAAAIYPAEVRATGVGWGIGLGRIGAVVSPYVTGLLLSQGIEELKLFLIFAITLGLSGFFVRKLQV